MCIGSCLNPFLTFLLLGKDALETIEMVLFGKPFCIVFCGVFGGYARSFEDLERNLLDFKMIILRTLLDWISSLGCFSLFSIFDLMNLCNLWR